MTKAREGNNTGKAEKHLQLLCRKPDGVREQWLKTTCCGKCVRRGRPMRNRTTTTCGRWWLICVLAPRSATGGGGRGPPAPQHRCGAGGRAWPALAAYLGGLSSSTVSESHQAKSGGRRPVLMKA